MDLIETIHDFPSQIREAVALAKGVKVDKGIEKVIVCGMGASGIPGNFLKSLYYDSKVSFHSVKGYSLPGWVDSRTLVFVISYSGNTEETVSCFREAMRKGCKVVVITSGGKLKELVKYHKMDTAIYVPDGLIPRGSVGYLFFPALVVLHNSGIVRIKREELVAVIDALRKPALKQKAETLAEQMAGKMPIIYASNKLSGVALRWKQSFNENAKTHAFYNVFSEMNHNELMAYKFAKKSDFHIVLLRDEKDHPKVRKRFDFVKDIMKKKQYPVTEIMLRGQSDLVKMFTAVYIGDLTSALIAKRLKIAAEETGLQEELKKKLGR